MTGPQQAKRSFGDKLAYLIETVHPSRPRSPLPEIAAGSPTFCGMTASQHYQLVTCNDFLDQRLERCHLLGAPATYP